MIEQAVKEQEKVEAKLIGSGREELLLNPDTMFGDRFEAVMTDLLAQQHVSQIDPSGTGLFDQPEDHETKEDDPTSDF